MTITLEQIAQIDPQLLPPTLTDAQLARLERRAGELAAQIAEEQSHLAMLREAMDWNYRIRETKTI